MCDPLHPEPLHTRVFTWQSHMGRCGGDGKYPQTHEMVKLATQRLALCSPDPGGVAVPPSPILIIEPRPLRSDDSRLGDLYVVAGGHHAKDAAMDITISSSLSQSYLQHSSTSSDYALTKVENNKFTKDLRNSKPI
jgi:hypothetical protein